MKATPIAPDIHWVGAIDWNLRDFHGFETPRGSTYNAYLAGRRQDRPHRHRQGALRSRAARARAKRRAARQDRLHRGQPRRARPQRRHAHGRGQDAQREDRRERGWRAGDRRVPRRCSDITAVGADDSLDLGGLTLKFMPMPMVHWPDSMFTYCPERCTLMPNDAFGQHLASSSRFADEVGLELATEELIVYFANILMPSPPRWARRSEGRRGRMGLQDDRTEPRRHLARARPPHADRHLRPLHLRRHVRQARHRVRHDVGIHRPPRARDRRRRDVHRHRRPALRSGGDTVRARHATPLRRHGRCCWARQRCTTACSIGQRVTCST